jgi:hypothetical protein
MTFQEAWQEVAEVELGYALETIETIMCDEEEGRLLPLNFGPVLADMKEVLRKHVPR